MRDEILSSNAGVTTSRFVYSSLAFFGSRQGGELPGPWFTRALTPLGIEEGAIRQTLWRMERKGSLLVRRDGRVNHYSASAPTVAILDAGTEKILSPVLSQWNGEWTLVYYQFDGDQRDARDQVRDVLMVEGFAALGPGLYIHPRDRATRILGAVDAMGLADHVQAFRGPRKGAGPDDRFARSLWDLSGIADRYRRFLDRFSTLGEQTDAIDPLEAFGLRFALVIEYLEVAWDDPELPPELLPDDWPGVTARRLAKELYEAWLPLALEYAETVLAEVQEPARSST